MASEDSVPKGRLAIGWLCAALQRKFCRDSKESSYRLGFPEISERTDNRLANRAAAILSSGIGRGSLGLRSRPSRSIGDQLSGPPEVQLILYIQPMNLDRLGTD